MTKISTPFFTKVHKDEQLILRPRDGSQPTLSFDAAISSLVFIRCISSTTSFIPPVTISLLVHCNTVDNNSITYTIASHNFPKIKGCKINNEKKENEEVFIFPLKLPLLFTSHGSPYALEVKCTEMEKTSKSDATTNKNDIVYSVILHGIQRTALTKEQVLLLRGKEQNTKHE